MQYPHYINPLMDTTLVLLRQRGNSSGTFSVNSSNAVKGRLFRHRVKAMGRNNGQYKGTHHSRLSSQLDDTDQAPWGRSLDLDGTSSSPLTPPVCVLCCVVLYVQYCVCSIVPFGPLLLGGGVAYKSEETSPPCLTPSFCLSWCHLQGGFGCWRVGIVCARARACVCVCGEVW